MFDEPCPGLALAIAQSVLQNVCDLNRKGLTHLFAKKNLALSLKLVNQVYALDNGSITLSQRSPIARRRPSAPSLFRVLGSQAT